MCLYVALTVKESGLGQTAFSICPRIVGFLPYPTITVRSCSQQQQPLIDSKTLVDFGSVLSSFVRTQGKQVHVLSPLIKSTTIGGGVIDSKRNSSRIHMDF